MKKLLIVISFLCLSYANAQNTNKEATEANTQSKTIFQKIEEQNQSSQNSIEKSILSKIK